MNNKENNSLFPDEQSGSMADNGLEKNSFASGVRTITPSIARSMLERYSFPFQRTLRRYHVIMLANEMVKGTMRPSTIRLGRLGDKVYLLNGQHRLHAIVESGVTQSMAVEVVAASSMDELAFDYGTIDIQGQRTPSDTLRAFDFESKLQLSTQQIQKLGPATIELKLGFVDSRELRRSRSLRINCLKEFGHLGVPFFAAVSHQGPNYRLLLRTQIMAVALATFEHEPTRATSFWSGVAEDDGLCKGDPRKTFLQWLRKNPPRPNQFRNRYSRHAVLCWNAFFQGKNMQLISCPDDKINLLGTPYMI